MVLKGSYFDLDPAKNPTFYDWNMVFLRYCDGGSFSGTRDDPVQARPRPPETCEHANMRTCEHANMQTCVTGIARKAYRRQSYNNICSLIHLRSTPNRRALGRAATPGIYAQGCTPRSGPTVPRRQN